MRFLSFAFSFGLVKRKKAEVWISGLDVFGRLTRLKVRKVIRTYCSPGTRPDVLGFYVSKRTIMEKYYRSQPHLGHFHSYRCFSSHQRSNPLREVLLFLASLLIVVGFFAVAFAWAAALKGTI